MIFFLMNHAQRTLCRYRLTGSEEKTINLLENIYKYAVYTGFLGSVLVRKKSHFMQISFSPIISVGN